MFMMLCCNDLRECRLDIAPVDHAHTIAEMGLYMEKNTMGTSC